MKTSMYKTVIRLNPKPKLLRNLLAGCGLLLLLPSAQAVFTWPVYESFSEYTNTPLRLGADVTSNYWNFGNGTTGVSTYIITNAAALSYPALQPDPTNISPNGVQEVPNNTTSADRAAYFPGQTNTTIYASFLLNYQDNGGATADRCAFSLITGGTSTTNGGSVSSVYTAVWLTPDYRLQVTKNYNKASANFSAATPVLSTNVAHFIVMRYLKVTGGNDEVDLWLDPTPFGDDTRIPRPTISTTNAPNITYFNAMLLSNRKLINGTYYMNVFQVDEIRLDNTWSGVTPLASPAPGPMFTVTGGGTGCPGDTFPVMLSGSVATNDYWLYTNSVYAGATFTGNADGSALNMGSFSTPASYSVLASNNVNGNIGWMSNAVTINVRAPVSIVQQPSPATTATNSRAQFIVSCTGDQLGYQWYKDGSPLADDSHITGSKTGMLVVWPATSADIGGYYCGITNPCAFSPTLTTTSSLTLDAPNNLVWSGSSFGQNFWDIATTAVWNSGAATFNEGDSVTFDDTYNGSQYGSIITLNAVLTPTLLTYSTGQQLIFGGNGSIAGSAELLVTGSGRLVISNTVGAGVYAPNPYTGGTVIDNGIVYIQSWNSALGTGPITLAGGTLQSLIKGNAGVGLSNNVFVTTNSAWQTDQSGQQSASLMGALIGSPGVTLTFTNNSTLTNSMNWVYLNAPFTNNCAIVLSSAATNSTQRLVCNNTNGAQIYNGVISEVFTGGAGEQTGHAGLIKTGAGALYLNAANTYTTGTTNTAGLLAGSGSITGPLVVTNGTLGGGSANAIGTFTVKGDVTLINGNVYTRVNKSLAQSNDMISVTGAITNSGAGTVTVTNIGATALAAGDILRIFSGAVSDGADLVVTGGGVGWANHLAVDGSIQAVSAIAAYPTNVSYSATGGTLALTWPATHLGWVLQSQTNALSTGLSPTNGWYDVLPSTANVTSTSIPVTSTNATVFYRLRHP
jgi:autotransporter-associated beta strand protein